MTSFHTRRGIYTLALLFLTALLLTACGKPTLDTINVEPDAATLTVGQTLQLRATGLDSKGKPMSDLTFTWAVDGPHGRIDANGLLTAVSPGTAMVTVASGTVRRTATVTVEREKVASLTLSGAPTELVVGKQAALTVTANNATGQGIAEVQVQAQPTSKDTIVEPTTATTDATGQATFTITMAPQVAANQIQFRADALQTTLAIQGLAGAPAVLQLTPSATTAIAGETVQLQASVQDAAGNPVRGAEVQFSALSAGAVAAPAKGTSDAQGKANAVITLHTKAGVNRLQAVVAGLPPQTVDVQGRAGAPARITLQADSTDTVAGGMLTLSILLHDKHGNGVPATPIDLSATPAGAALEGKAVTTDASGQAQVRLQTSTEAGANTVQALVANLPAAPLTVTGHPPTTLSLAPQTATVEMLAAQRFVATISDASGHSTVIMPTWKVVGEAGNIDAEGTFSAHKLGSDAIVATYADLTAGAQLTVVPGAVASIRLTPAEATVVSGATQQFRVEAFNAQQYALEITPTWSVSNNVGTVDTSGLFTASKAGEGEVIVTADGTSGRARITVKTGELAAITVTPERLALKAGEELQLQAQGRDAAGNSVPIEPTWALAVNLGELDPSTGMFRARYAGKGQLRVEAGSRPTVTEIPVEVAPAALEKVEVQPPTLTMAAGEEFAFTATGYDAFGNAISVTPVWELTADLGTITSAGELKAQRTGAALVRATVGQLAGQASLIIKPGKLTSLTIDPAGPLVLAAGASVSLGLSGQDAFGNVVAVTPSWSQSEALGTLSDDGVFRAETVGTIDIIAQSQDLRASVQISTTPGQLAKIVLTPPSSTILAGETLQFKATGLDAYKNEVAIQPTWRVTADIGDITAAGKFKALQAVNGEIVAMAEGISGTAQVTVQPGPLTLLKVTPEAMSLTAGDTTEIVVVGYDAFGNPVPAEPVWQITEGMGTVDHAGVFTAQKAGEGRLVVIVGHLAAVINLQVMKGEVASLRVSPAPSRVASGQQQQFTVEGFDRGGNPVPVEVTWEVQGTIGSIDAATGLFTATMVETGHVIAQAGSLRTTVEVVVEPGAVATLRVTPESANLVAGDQLELHSEAFDAAGNRAPITPTWTVTEDMGTVSAEGVLQARRAGTGHVIGRIGPVQQTIPLQISAGPLATIALQPATWKLKAGDTREFAAFGADAYGNPVPVEPTWSMQGNIGKIDATHGIFEAITAGSGTVVAVMGQVAGLAPVTVEAGAAAHLQLRPERLTLQAGEKGAFTATAFDQFHNPTSTDITWDLTAPLGTMVNGEIQARQAGTAAAIARVGDIEARGTVEVKPGPLARLQVIPRSLELASGSTLQFRSLGYDRFDNMQEVAATWSLSGDIGRLDAHGLFTAGATGQGQVTARLGDFAQPVEVTVVPGPVQHLLLSPRRAELPATSSQRFTVTGLDAGGNPQEVTVRWALTQGIGTLDRSGQLTAMHVGAGSAVAYTPDALVGVSDIRIVPGPVALLFVTPQPSTLRAGQTTQFLVQGYDAYRNPIPALAPQWEVYGDIGSIDPASGLFTAKQMGWGKVTAVVHNKLGGADVMVEPGMPDAEQSRLVSSRVTLPADGKTTATIVVQVRDQFGNAVTGARVTLISSREDRIEQPPPSNAQGMAVGRIHSTKSGLSEISAVVESVRLSNSLRVTFNQPGASG